MNEVNINSGQACVRVFGRALSWLIPAWPISFSSPPNLLLSRQCVLVRQFNYIKRFHPRDTNGLRVEIIIFFFIFILNEINFGAILCTNAVYI
jgi:hypothetical protein